MKAQTVMLSLDHSAALLERIFPEENWTGFLSKNIRGLTKGYPTIPFDKKSPEISYELGALEDFAVTYGKHKLSAKDVRSIRGSYLLDRELDELLVAINDDSSRVRDSRNSFLKARSDARGNLRLNPSEISALFRIVDESAKEQMETRDILTTLALAVRALDSGVTLSSEEITALSGVAAHQADRACSNAERIRSLFSEINTCPA